MRKPWINIWEKRLASERDSTIVIYNLFGIPSWGNFYKLGMFNLYELQNILELRRLDQPIDIKSMMNTLKRLAMLLVNLIWLFQRIGCKKHLSGF